MYTTQTKASHVHVMGYTGRGKTHLAVEEMNIISQNNIQVKNIGKENEDAQGFVYISKHGHPNEKLTRDNVRFHIITDEKSLTSTLKDFEDSKSISPRPSFHITCPGLGVVTASSFYSKLFSFLIKNFQNTNSSLFSSFVIFIDEAQQTDEVLLQKLLEASRLKNTSVWVIHQFLGQFSENFTSSFKSIFDRAIYFYISLQDIPKVRSMMNADEDTYPDQLFQNLEDTDSIDISYA